MRQRVLVSLSLAATFIGCGQAALVVEELEESLTGCGVERWSVKTGTDPDVGRVNFTPQDTTIAVLRALPMPSSLPPNARLAPTETTTFRLTNVTLLEYKLEGDSDIHLVLCDASNACMIAEIPSPGCVGAGSPFTTGAAKARADFDARYTATGTYQFASVPATVIGVGMFDFLHGQTGVAPNGVELHSVLGICFGAGCTIGSGSDGGTPDAGGPDAGGPDGGLDSGVPDSGVQDAGSTGTPPPTPAAPSGGCSTAATVLPWLIAAAALFARRRSSLRSQ
jgi:hypothetical protein